MTSPSTHHVIIPTCSSPQTSTATPPTGRWDALELQHRCSLASEDPWERGRADLLTCWIGSFLYRPRKSHLYWIRPYVVEYTGSHPNSEVKPRSVQLVVWWGTTCESCDVVSFCLFFCSTSHPPPTLTHLHHLFGPSRIVGDRDAELKTALGSFFVDVCFEAF